MTKPLEAYIAELQKVIDGPNGTYWAHGPAVSALIAALEQSRQEKDKWVKWATELGEKCDRLEASQSEGTIGVFNIGSETCPDHLVVWTEKGRTLPSGVYWIYTAPVEASQLAVKLPQRLSPEGYHIDEAYLVPDDEGDYLDRDEVIEAIRAAGGTVKGDE